MIDPKSIDWEKMEDLVPAVVQDSQSKQVLMVGYMNREALDKTLETGQVTFFSRSRKSLWTKGETSGNTLKLVKAEKDCDSDAVLIQATPAGPTCHLETTSCFGEEKAPGIGFLSKLDALVEKRLQDMPEGSYTTRLYQRGLPKIAQKVGEEAVETVIASQGNSAEELLNESADLLFHLIVLLRAKGHALNDVVEVLRSRSGNH